MNPIFSLDKKRYKKVRVRQHDGRCEHYVFDQELKAQMKQDKEKHDGFRRCDNQAKQHDSRHDVWLCTYHYNRRYR